MAIPLWTNLFLEWKFQPLKVLHIDCKNQSWRAIIDTSPKTSWLLKLRIVYPFHYTSYMLFLPFCNDILMLVLIRIWSLLLCGFERDYFSSAPILSTAMCSWMHWLIAALLTHLLNWLFFESLLYSAAKPCYCFQLWACDEKKIRSLVIAIILYLLVADEYSTPYLLVVDMHHVRNYIYSAFPSPGFTYTRAYEFIDQNYNSL